MTDKVFDNYTIPNYKTFYLIVEIIDILLKENKMYMNAWNKEWDGHIGDLSEPSLRTISAEHNTLTTIRNIILNGDRRIKDLGSNFIIEDKVIERRDRDLFKMAIDIVEGRN